ncbi:MAG: DNA mismatch repair endonuclease MutL [Calditrichaeota bacterium]|nr:DNA mismatch repair endonuclease MutL [Calditrichota bacterium]MCB9368043.1 DNA mismatch repair endonuclease MutL [Calditrichota bacterium]
MAKIRILPEQLVNQIAAGEVIERPASVLRELLDNALDAGATKIDIELEGSGRELIAVRDNGCGMSRDDMLLSLERHATSKLSAGSNLFAIETLGFRGEALPSIASVSDLELISREKSTDLGFRLHVVGGDIADEEAVAAPAGTQVRVRTIFFNTPARAKFLKADATELSHSIRVLRTYALAYPQVAWTFRHGDSLQFVWPSADFHGRIADVFGVGIQNKLLDVAHELRGVKVHGVLGHRELNRRGRGDQFFFVNRRPFQSTGLAGVSRGALRDWTDGGEWPFYIIFIDVEASSVDVNVHPAKREVRFSDERLIHAAVFEAFRGALKEQQQSLDELRQTWIPTQQTTPPGSLDNIREAGGLFTTSTPFVDSTRAPSPPLTYSQSYDVQQSQSPQPQSFNPRLRAQIYQIHNKYLIAPIRSGLAIIDQHAAHERVLYERALKSFDSRTFASQQLLFPLLLELTPEEDASFQEIRKELDAFGFVLREFGPRSYSIDAVPAGLKRASEASMLREMIAEYDEFRRARLGPRESLAAGFACKAAIKTGDELTIEEMTALVDELFATKQPGSCPHGRPTFIELKLSELDYRFGRTG